ncbi:hypothetical protein L5515_015827 [Caenorhabditis briggsae]|uniref:PAN-3 domain-containing protein n=1 Tax=Caenorhabditis briggsae TaxID=6238 RepID=A0AAE9JAG4_CAEBR|nr:hypothetical protein L5515_015827 [Caenorhabditis briggsae]
MKFLPILLIYLLFSPLSQATYKMVAINGAPDLKDSYPYKVITGISWEACHESCMGNFEALNCYMVYFKGDRCSFYFLGDFYKVRNDGSQSTMENEMVAFRLDIPNGECLGSASDTIASQTGYASSLATDITGIGISVTSESYDVSYNYVDECNRPYRTGIPCEKTCPSRMYNFHGTVLMKKGDKQSNGPWNQCVTKCHRDENCILAASDNYTACVLFGIETFTELTLSDSYEIDSTSTDYLAIKLINTTPDFNCPADENALFSSTIDVTSFLEEGSDHKNFYMTLKKTGNTVKVDCFRGTISMEYGDSNQPPMTWTQCVNRCLQNNRCILAVTNTYFKCVLFEIETFDKFNLNYNYEIDPTTPNYMAIKVQNNFTKCAKSPSELLLSAPSVYQNPPIKSYKFSAETPTSYTINYEYDFVDNCSDWLDPVPKCTNCPKSMMSFRGVPKLVNPIASSLKSWKECMYECYKDSYCHMAYMKNYPDCRMVYYGNVDNVIRIETPPTSSTALHFAAIKYVTDDITCTMNFTSLWTAGRPMKSETSASNYSAYQPTTSGLSSTFSWIGKNSGCIPGFTEKIAGVSGCVRLVLFNNLTVNRSAAIAGCYKYGTYGLMTISSSEAFSVFRKAMTTISRQAGTYHIGLSRKTATSAWQWDFPELEIDKSGIVWANGEPKSPNLYAYLEKIISADHLKRLMDNFAMSRLEKFDLKFFV